MSYLATRDGTRLFFNDWGTGHPVILVHGWPLNADMWEYQMREMVEAGFRCIAYDRRGFGRSDQPWSGYDYDTFANDLADLIAHRGLDRASLVGFSMGGGEIARYLTRYGPAKVAKVALIGSVTPFLLKTADNPEGVDQATFDGMVEGLAADRPHFLSGFAKAFYGAGMLNSKVSDEILEWTAHHAYAASARATLASVRAFSETDFRGDMASFAGVPTLVVHGTGDQTVPIDASARRTARLIPHAELREYDGAPHGLFYTAREQLTNDLVSFLADAGDARLRRAAAAE